MQNVKTFIRMFDQLNTVLAKEHKRRALFIVVFSIISAFLETLGVSVMLPLVLAILQPEKLMEYKILVVLADVFKIESIQGVVLFVSLGVIVVFILKNTFIIWFGRYKSVYRNIIEKDLSYIMFKRYIYKSYQYYLNHNTVDMERGVSSDVSAVASVTEAFTGLFNECLVCLMIGIMLLIINPVMAVSIGIIASCISVIIIQILRKKISICGEKTRLAYIRRSRYAYEAFNGIKEIDVMQRQKQFLRRFEDTIEEAYGYNVTYTTMSMLPSRLTEVMFISGIIIVAYFAYLMTDNSSMLVAQFGALGVAAIRVLPSITNISGSMNALVYNRSMLENAYENITGGNEDSVATAIEFNDASDNDDKEHFESVLRIDNVRWRYANNLPYVLKGVTMEIRKGESIGIIGESGAGKTTLGDIILGLYKSCEGTITVDGKDIFEERTGWYQMVGYVPQNVFLIDESIRKNILFGIDEELYDEDKMKEVIKKAQLEKVVDSLQNGLDTVLGERGIRLSGGQRQRIAIARALYHDPDILVLDEATSALDNDTEEAIMDAINELQGQKTLIIIAHRLTTIANCDKIFEIKDGVAYLKKEKSKD